QAAFQLETFPGESSITKDLAANAGKSVLEMSAFGLAAKYFNGLSAADEVVFPWGGESIAGAKATATTGEVVATEATSANAQAALRAKLSGLQKAQETAAVTRKLPDGRIRYYTQEVPVRTEGPTRGASFATEFDPETGSTRQWMESYDHAGEVIRVHPKSINGQPVDAQHYPPTGAELKSWGQQ
ncbi:hypothetical protein, partial [Pseudomonas cannabina]|uniref:hypothetical protein n=2 Tax=Pseudomonas cannabina TaxID=86840 RepID=UPI001CC31605